MWMSSLCSLGDFEFPYGRSPKKNFGPVDMDQVDQPSLKWLRL